jgi:hypothetical protein
MPAERPCIDCDLDPRRHGHRSHSAVLADEIHDAPPAVPLLDVTERKRCDFGPSQSASQEHGEDSPIAQSLNRGGVRRVQERLGLFCGEPVAEAYTLGSDALYARDAIRQFWR